MGPSSMLFYVKVNNENFVQCKNLVYLGSVILNSAKLGKELMYRISKAMEARKAVK